MTSVSDSDHNRRRRVHVRFARAPHGAPMQSGRESLVHVLVSCEEEVNAHFGKQIFKSVATALRCWHAISKFLVLVAAGISNLGLVGAVASRSPRGMTHTKAYNPR